MSDVLEAPLPVALSGERDCPAEAGQVALVSGYPFDETIDRLKAAIAAEDLWVIHEIDPQMLLRRGGYAIPPTRQLLYFHPRLMARLLAANAAAIVEVPLKVVIMTAGSGETVLRYPDPAVFLARYLHVSDLGRELSALAERVVGAVASRTEPPLC